MRLVLENYGDVRIYSDRPYGYKRFIVEWSDGTKEVFSGLWYKEKTIRKIVEEKLND